jgi:tRNA-2-methylthio-N6-dimethylallyladenosine synthase
VLAEISRLAESGVREVTLLGQNVNAYRGPTGDGTIADLALLITYVAEIPGIERIRFTTSHPAEFNDRLIEAFAHTPRLAAQLHLPVQSGSDRVLGMMKRGYTRAQYVEKLRRLREVRPGISISSDFIIGFPTETEADFQATMALIDEVRFDNAYSFIYSKRPGTPAAMLVDNITQEEKERRLQVLQQRIQELAREYSHRMLGSVQRVLVERHSSKRADQLTGRTENNRWVNFDGDARLIGQFADVVITEALPNSLRGRVLVRESVAA